MLFSSPIYVGTLFTSLFGLQGAALLDPTPTCLQNSTSDFNIQAIYKDTPNGPPVGINLIDAGTVPHVGWGILSVCNTTCGWDYSFLNNSGYFPRSKSNSYLQTQSYSLVEGDSPSFISVQFPPPPLTVYCTMSNPLDEAASSSVLAANKSADEWSLCSNTTAFGRLDVVWSAKANHPHYDLSNCRQVWLRLV